MGFSEMEMGSSEMEMEMEMGCKRHPNEIQQPGICSSCLRENLALVSSSSANFYASKNTNNTVFFSSYSSASYSSVSSSPSTPRRLPGGSHRRNGSDVMLKTGPSMADAAVNRISQGTKVLTEGGYEKIFRQTFETVSEEKLLNTYACYLSTSAGPVMGVLYVSTLKLAFCSDNPLSYKDGDLTKWSYYKVVMPFYQLKAVNPSTSIVNPAEKYIQVISIDNHEFWFMRFVLYDNAVKTLQEAMQNRG